MKLSKQDFLDQDQKIITFVGMSGVGKTYLSCLLADSDWRNFSVDYLIGTYYLKDLISEQTIISPDNISVLSDFVGQIGDPAKGGLPVEQFAERQKAYYEAECRAVEDACEAIDIANVDFVTDSSGSLCEIEDEALIGELGKRSLFVYLKVRQEGHAELLSRAVENPKPLYFPPTFLEERLEHYKSQFDVKGVEEIEPLEFLRWVFPFLFESRLPKYQALADAYGVSIYSDQFDDAKTADDIVKVIANSLEEA